MPLNNFFVENQDEGNEDQKAILSEEECPEIPLETEPKESVNDDEQIVDLQSCIKENEKLKADPSQFSLLCTLGQGSFGKVFLVRKDWGHRTGEYFAMKVLKKAVLKVRDRVRTKMERDILAAVRHPFIVQLHFEGKLFLVIDLVPGGDLFSRLSKDVFRSIIKVMFTEDDAKIYLAEIAMALDHLHKLGIIYRDLKPENVLLASDGHIKLTDFGLCKESILEDKKTYSFCGTVEYMAPEVILRKGHGPAADWWSFGVMMFEMLTGYLPFQSPCRRETMQLILKAHLKMPSTFSPEAQKIIRLLFKRNQEIRLGYKNGIEELKIQPFFLTLDFDKLYRKEIFAPFLPTINLDTSGNAFYCRDNISNLVTPGIVSADTRLFQGFSFVAPPNDNTTNYVVKEPTATTIDIFGSLPVRTSSITLDYELLEVIGTGSYSKVHRAVNKTNGQRYAVKVVDRHKRDCREEIDVFATNDFFYLVMEYLRGGDLLTRINEQKSFSEKESAHLIAVLASALAYLHEHGVVHRDLKPSNIMFLDTSGRPESVRITDFGFAKQMRAENGLLMTPCYTANYVAPEVLQRQGYDASCDIWSLGIVLYAMISGTTPYMNNDQDDPNVILQRITHGQINLTNGIWNNVSSQAKALISSMVHVNPSLRPTAKQILSHPWILKKEELSNVRLQHESWRLKDAMKSMFNAFNTSKDTKSLSSIKNSGIMKRRANKRDQDTNII